LAFETTPHFPIKIDLYDAVGSVKNKGSSLSQRIVSDKFRLEKYFYLADMGIWYSVNSFQNFDFFLRWVTIFKFGLEIIKVGDIDKEGHS
jgi:hypothetical protein